MIIDAKGDGLMKFLKKMKILVAAIGIMGIVFSSVDFSARASGTENKYKETLEEINETYDLDLEYCPIDTSKVSIEEYRNVVEQVAIQQRDLKEMIEKRASQDNSDRLISTRETKTVTKSVWQDGLSGSFKITATYDVNGMIISNPRDISYHRTLSAIILGINYSPYPGYPTTNILDTGRTLSVTYYGVYIAGNTSVGNTMLYTEFYYSDN